MWRISEKKQRSPYDEIRRIHNEIIIAVRRKIMHSRDREYDQATAKLDEKLEATIWWDAPRDMLQERLDQAVADIEKTCRPIIAEAVKT